MKELQKKELLLPKILIENEDQAMGPDSGIATTILLTELIHIMDSIIRTEDDHLIDGHINSPTEVKKIYRIMEITVTKMELGEVMEIFRVHPQDKDETFQEEMHFANVNLLKLGNHHLEDQMIIQSLVPLLLNKNFRKAIFN